MGLNRPRMIIVVSALLVIATAPFWTSRYMVNLLILIFLYMSFASMWNLLAGYSGLVSMGQQMFIGLGGYTLAVLCMYYKIPLLLSIATGGLMSGVLSILISLPIFRMKGVYFTIGTWIIAEILAISFSNWDYVRYGMGIFIQPAEKYSMTTTYFGALIIYVLFQQFLSEYIGFNLIILGGITIIIIIFATKGIVGILQSKFGLVLFPIHRR